MAGDKSINKKTKPTAKIRKRPFEKQIKKIKVKKFSQWQKKNYELNFVKDN